jgi:prefoldin subunit 5
MDYRALVNKLNAINEAEAFKVASQDIADRIKKAVVGLGTDETAVYKALADVAGPRQWAEIQSIYPTVDEDLLDDFSDWFGTELTYVKDLLLQKGIELGKKIVIPAEDEQPKVDNAANLAKLNDLVAKLQAAHAGHVKKESTDFSMASALTESFGYMSEGPAVSMSGTGDNYDRIFGSKQPAATPGWAQTKLNGGNYKATLPAATPTTAPAATAKAPSFAQGNYNVKVNAPTSIPSTVNAATKATADATKAAAPGVKAAAAVAADAAPVVGKGALAAAKKIGARALPGAGLALGAYDAYNRVKQGDYTGAAIDAAGGIAGLVPGVGTAAQLGLMGVQAGRDKARTGSFFPDDEEIKAAANSTPAPQGKPIQGALPTAKQVDPKVKAMQDELLKVEPGALPKYGADGRFGTETKTALGRHPDIAKKYGMVAEGVSANVSSLRAKMAQIEESKLEENLVGDALKALARGGANLIKGATAAAKAGPEYKAAVRAGGASKVGARVNKAILQNPVKAGLAAGAAGLGTGYALTPNAPTPTPTPTPTPGPTPTPNKPEAGGLPEDAAEVALIKEIQALMQQLGQVKDDAEITKALANAKTVIDTVNSAHGQSTAGKPEGAGLPADAKPQAANAFDLQRGKAPAEPAK